MKPKHKDKLKQQITNKLCVGMCMCLCVRKPRKESQDSGLREREPRWQRAKMVDAISRKMTSRSVQACMRLEQTMTEHCFLTCFFEYTQDIVRQR